MKFGLALDFAHPTRTLDQQIDHYRNLLRVAERYGYDSVTLGEGYPAEPSWGHVPSPLLVLAALAVSAAVEASWIASRVSIIPNVSPSSVTTRTDGTLILSFVR